jgi:hypothetical protein
VRYAVVPFVVLIGAFAFWFVTWSRWATGGAEEIGRRQIIILAVTAIAASLAARYCGRKQKHYDAVRARFPGPLCRLDLVAAQPMGTNVYLTYRWRGVLSRDEADIIDTRTRAFINSMIDEAAKDQSLPCIKGRSEASLLGVPIPAWHVAGRAQPTFVQNSTFDVSQNTIDLTVGMRFVHVAQELMEPDEVACALATAFKRRCKSITV